MAFTGKNVTLQVRFIIGIKMIVVVIFKKINNFIDFDNFEIFDQDYDFY